MSSSLIRVQKNPTGYTSSTKFIFGSHFGVGVGALWTSSSSLSCPAFVVGLAQKIYWFDLVVEHSVVIKRWHMHTRVCHFFC